MYTYRLADIMRRDWDLARSTTPSKFTAFLIKHELLTAWDFISSVYESQQIERFAWGEVSPMVMALSLKSRGYLCHASAMTVHGISKTDHNALYLNVEQSAKPPGHGSLSQERIDLAFKREQRRSNLSFICKNISVVIIAGKNTENIGVIQMKGPAAETLRVTGLPRTLVDIVVRPAYAGGVQAVLDGYRAAQDLFIAQEVEAILEKMGYVYPYHQAIGFLMQRAGYSSKSYEPFHALGLKHDFYLAHGMQNPSYSKEWRLFYPADLD